MPVSFVEFMLSIQRRVRGYNIKPWDGYRRRELPSIQMHSVGADPEKTGETTSNIRIESASSCWQIPYDWEKN
jgi:hypothetical protein